jgi:hypothetical protein
VQVQGLRALDLTDEGVRLALSLTETDLIGDDYAATQRIADAARDGGFDGILAPSAALPRRLTLVVFLSGMKKVAVQVERVRQPPPRLVDLLRVIRARHDMPAACRAFMRSLLAEGADAVRSKRRMGQPPHR